MDLSSYLLIWFEAVSCRSFCFYFAAYHADNLFVSSKYPFAIVAKMLDVFGKDLALGYDIGCRLETTLNHSPLSKDVQIKNHCCLVGAFHGHAHNRLCQSQFLATYVEGLGIEDLEGCERFFAKSNALAASMWHASMFHRRQAIYEYAMYHGKFETYQNLSKHCTLSNIY